MCEGNIRLAVRRLGLLVLLLGMTFSWLHFLLWSEIARIKRSQILLQMRIVGRPWSEAVDLFRGSYCKEEAFQYEGQSYKALYFPSGANGVDLLIIIDKDGLIKATATGAGSESELFIKKAFQSVL